MYVWYEEARKERNETFDAFFKVLELCETSIYRFLCKYFLFYLISSYVIQALYQFTIDESKQQSLREIRDLMVIIMLDDRVMVVVLACYMAKMVDRIAETCRLIRFPDKLLVVIASTIPGYTRLRRTVKSTIVRFALASYILTLRKVNYAVNKQFPDLATMVNAGILTTNEAHSLREYESKGLEYRLPLEWAGMLISRGHSDDLLSQDAVGTLVSVLAAQTDTMSQLLVNDQVGSTPQYTSAILILVFFYNVSGFLLQVIPDKGDMSDLSTFLLNPLPSAVLFACYRSALKVAEILNRPLKFEKDFLGLNRLINDHVEEISDRFRQLLAERRDFRREAWYDHALADESRVDDDQVEAESALEEIDELYEGIRGGSTRNGIMTGQNVALEEEVDESNERIGGHTRNGITGQNVALEEEVVESNERIGGHTRNGTMTGQNEAPEEEVDESNERIGGHTRNGITGQHVAIGNQVSTPVSHEVQKRHTVLVHSPDATPSVAVQLVQERTRDQQSLVLGLNQRQEDLQNIEGNLSRLRNTDQYRTDGFKSGSTSQPRDDDIYVDIETVLSTPKHVPKTNPARKCEVCYKFYLTDEEVKDLEEKTNGFEDVRKYRKLQCKCVRGVWV